MALILEVVVNGERFTVAGEETLSVLSAHVTASGKLGERSHGARGQQDAFAVDLSVHGLTNRGKGERDEHLHWGKRLPLKHGDEVRIVVREGSDFDDPTWRNPAQRYPSQSLSARRRFVDAKSLYFRLRHRYGSWAERQERQWRRRVMPHLR